MWAVAVTACVFATAASALVWRADVRAAPARDSRGGHTHLTRGFHQQQDAWYLYLPLTIQHCCASRPTPTPAESPTMAPRPSATVTDTPAPTDTPTAVDTPTATQTDTPSATPSPTPVPGPAWLAYVNMYRHAADLPELVEQANLSEGALLHGRYMVKNSYIGHTEDPNNPWYTAAGKTAAENGNVYVSGRLQATYRDAVNLWMTGPFHMLGIVDPRLTRTGYGDYTEDIGSWHFGATINVLSARDRPVADITFPVFYPAEGAVLPDLLYAGNESPDPLTSCSGYEAPTGPPVALQLGAGTVTPNVRDTRFLRGGAELPHCKFDQTDYQNPDAGWRDLGRGILRMRSAIVIMPRDPLQPGAAYEIEVDTGDVLYHWGFTAASAEANGGAGGDRMSAPPPTPSSGPHDGSVLGEPGG